MVALLRPPHATAEEGEVTLDFTLHEDVTQYVLAVAFDEDWALAEVVMES